MSEERLTVAVIGAGYWGKNLVRNFATAKRCTLKYVCDLNENVLQMHKKSFPFIQTTTEVEAVLDDKAVQAVVIATPVPTRRCKRANTSMSRSR